MKDPLGGQGNLKNYINASRNFELGRLDHLQTLNDINISFNMEIINRMCMIFTSEMVVSFFKIKINKLRRI